MFTILTDEFLSKYPNQPTHLKQLPQDFGFAKVRSTGIYETWKEICTRYVEGNIKKVHDHFFVIGSEYPQDKLQEEAETLFDNIFNLRQFPSKNALLNTGRNKVRPEYDSYFVNVKRWESFVDAISAMNEGIDVSMLIKKDEAKLYQFHKNIEYLHVFDKERTQTARTSIERDRNCTTIKVGKSAYDVKQFLQHFFFSSMVLIIEPKQVVIDYSNLTEKEADAYREFIQQTKQLMMEDESEEELVISTKTAFKIASIYADCVEKINNVRPNLRFITTPDDPASLIEWDESTSIMVGEVDEDTLREVIEYGYLWNTDIINETRLKKVFMNAEGVAYDGVSVLASGTYANNVTVNANAFIKESEKGVKALDYPGLMQAQALAIRSAMRTNMRNPVQERDNPIALSLIGWNDAMKQLNYTIDNELVLLELLKECASIEALKYAKTVRVNIPVTDTAVRQDTHFAKFAEVSVGFNYDEPKELDEHFKHVYAYQQEYSSQGVCLPIKTTEHNQEDIPLIVEDMKNGWGKLTSFNFENKVLVSEGSADESVGSDEKEIDDAVCPTVHGRDESEEDSAIAQHGVE